MHSLRATALPFLLASVIFFFGVTVAHAQTFDTGATTGQMSDGTCPNAGEQPAATAEDVQKMLLAGFPKDYAKIGACWKPSDQNVGAAVSEAKQYLRSILCADSQFGGAGPDGTVQGLNGSFAVCAAKFLRAASTQLPGQKALFGGGTNPICLREGYRTPDQQKKYYEEFLRNPRALACGPNFATCEHPSGRAIDINTALDSSYPKLWQMATNFGLRFGLGWRDKVHFRPEVGACLSGGTTPGGGTIPQYGPTEQLPPTMFDFPQYEVPPGATQPTSPLQSFFNSLFGGMQQPLQPLPLPTQSPYQQPFQQIDSQYQQVPQYTTENGSDIYPSTQNTYASSQNTSGSSTATSSQTQGQQGRGDLGNLYSSSTIQTGSGDNAADIINQYANLLADRPLQTSSSSSAGLNINLQTIGSLQGAQQNTGSGLSYQGQYENPYGVTQTFQPLYGDSGSSQYSAQQLNSLGGILERLRIGLLSFLRYLQPFGGRNPYQMIVD